VMEETLAAFNLGVDIQGVCLFPAIGSPDWNSDRFMENGFYDIVKDGPTLNRKLYQPLVQELLYWQQQLNCVNMLSDGKLNEGSLNHKVKDAARRLQPVPDRNWHR
jgi:hypothetical protein